MAGYIQGPPIDKSHIPSALEKNLRAAALSTISDLESYYNDIYNVADADTYITREAMYYGMGLYPGLAENADPTYDAGGEAWNQAYTMQFFGLGTEVSWQAILFDYHGVIKALTDTGGNIAMTARYTREVNALDIFNTYATSSTGAPTGKLPSVSGTVYPLLSKTLPLADGTTWANRTDVDVDIAQETLEMFYGFWRLNQKNQRGQLTMEPMETLLHGSKEKMLVDRILKTPNRAQSADNDINPLKSVGLTPKEHPLLSSDGRFFLMGRKASTGLRYWEFTPFSVKRFPDGSNGNMRFVGIFSETHGLLHQENLSGSI